MKVSGPEIRATGPGYTPVSRKCPDLTFLRRKSFAGRALDLVHFASRSQSFRHDQVRRVNLPYIRKSLPASPGKSCFTRRVNFTRRTKIVQSRGLKLNVLSDPERSDPARPSSIVPRFELRSRPVFYARRNIARDCPESGLAKTHARVNLPQLLGVGQVLQQGVADHVDRDPHGVFVFVAGAGH
jgi:hypothetical protein